MSFNSVGRVVQDEEGNIFIASSLYDVTEETFSDGVSYLQETIDNNNLTVVNSAEIAAGATGSLASASNNSRQDGKGYWLQKINKIVKFIKYGDNGDATPGAGLYVPVRTYGSNGKYGEYAAHSFYFDNGEGLSWDKWENLPYNNAEEAIAAFEKAFGVDFDSMDSIGAQAPMIKDGAKPPPPVVEGDWEIVVYRTIDWNKQKEYDKENPDGPEKNLWKLKFHAFSIEDASNEAREQIQSRKTEGKLVPSQAYAK